MDNARKSEEELPNVVVFPNDFSLTRYANIHYSYTGIRHTHEGSNESAWINENKWRKKFGSTKSGQGLECMVAYETIKRR